MQLNPTTLLFETINFLVLVWLLTKLLYNPLRRAIASREQALALQRDEAEQALARAREQEETWARKNDELVSLAEQVRSKALQDAVAERARMLSQAHDDAEAERAKVERLLEAERRDAEQWVRSMAIEQSTELTGRLLLSLAPDVLDEVLCTRLCEELRAAHARLAPDAERQKLDEVEITAARMPSEALLAGLREALAVALGRAPRVALREDPALLAGVVVRIGDRVLDASVAGQLDAFRERAQRLVLEPAHG